MGHPHLHLALRAATEEMHERLHRHVGFAAIKSAAIRMSDYRELIVRLYGFYVPFEEAVATESIRCAWLEEDLRALGLVHLRDTVPRCPPIPRLADPHFRLGARYVAEGSALGGRELARGLDRLLGQDVMEGRRFFIGRGCRTGEAWRDYLAQLSSAPAEPSARAQIVQGAVATFTAFENWLGGWSTLSHG